MADVWKSEVLPRIQKVFGGGGSSKKVAAAEVVKSFDESKVGVNASSYQFFLLSPASSLLFHGIGVCTGGDQQGV